MISKEKIYQVDTPEFEAEVKRIESEIKDYSNEQILNDINRNTSLQIITPLLSRDVTKIPGFENPLAVQERVMMMASLPQPQNFSAMVSSLTGGIEDTDVFLQKLICKHRTLITSLLDLGDQALAPVVALILKAIGLNAIPADLLRPFVEAAKVAIKIGLSEYCENSGNIGFVPPGAD